MYTQCNASAGGGRRVPIITYACQPVPLRHAHAGKRQRSRSGTGCCFLSFYMSRPICISAICPSRRPRVRACGFAYKQLQICDTSVEGPACTYTHVVVSMHAYAESGCAESALAWRTAGAGDFMQNGTNRQEYAPAARERCHVRIDGQQRPRGPEPSHGADLLRAQRAQLPWSWTLGAQPAWAASLGGFRDGRSEQIPRVPSPLCAPLSSHSAP
jgi:hypothetical protein